MNFQFQMRPRPVALCAQHLMNGDATTYVRASNRYLAMRLVYALPLILAACQPSADAPTTEVSTTETTTSAVVAGTSPEDCATSVRQIGETLPEADAARFYGALTAVGDEQMDIAADEVDDGTDSVATEGLGEPSMEMFVGCQRYAGMTAEQVLATAP